MKNHFSSLIIILYFISQPSYLQAQNNIGIGTLTPNAKALLDLTANDKGLLVPRVTTTQRIAINPTGNTDAALLVYDTNDSLFYFWNSVQWVSFPQQGAGNNIALNFDTNSGLLSLTDNGGTINTDLSSLISDDWKLTGNSNTDANINFLGTIDNTDLVFRTNNTEYARLTSIGNIGIGTNTPLGKIDVDGANANQFYIGRNDINARIIGSDGNKLWFKPPIDGNDIEIQDGNTDNALRIEVASSINLRAFTPASGLGSFNFFTDTNFPNAAYFFHGNNNAEVMTIAASGNVRVNNLAGIGNRKVYADASGILTINTPPPGTVDAGPFYIDANERASATFWDASRTCGDLNGSLPTVDQFYYAAQKGIPGILNMTGNYEWSSNTNIGSGFGNNVFITVIGSGGNNDLDDRTANIPGPYRCVYAK